MDKTIDRATHTLDATDQSMGRLAVQISLLLRGKTKATFVPYRDDGDFVVVQNIKNLKFTGKKMEQKMYYHHSGYPGGGRERTLEQVFEKRPTEVLRRAVWGMLPKNKLRAAQIKRLKLEA